LAPSYLILQKENVGLFRSKLDEDIVINHIVGYRASTLAEHGLIDCIIVDAEDGFSQLGKMREFVSLDLGVERRDLVQHAFDGFPSRLERNIASLADWVRYREPEVTLVAIPSAIRDSCLKGIILSPHDGSRAYLRFAQGEYAKPHRDFIYNVTYESIAYAHLVWGAKNIGLTHFSRNKFKNHYHQDLTTCQAEAIVHFCNEYRGIESITFFDDSEGNMPLKAIDEMSNNEVRSVHRPIHKETLSFWGMDFVDINWNSVSLRME
jgi:hypothetical protein